MDTWFPTFRGLLGNFPMLPALRPWRTSSAQQRSLMRLIAVAAEENLPLSPLVRAWAADETGIQSRRLNHLADLLSAGTPLPDAVEEVHGALSDEDILAVRFGAQSGTLTASMRDRLTEPGPATLRVASRMRKLLIYVCVVLSIGVVVVSFLEIKIMPELNKIISEFDIPRPAPMNWSIAFANFVANYWYLVVLVLLAIAWLVFASWPGRRLRWAIWARLFWPLRELYTADVLRKLGIAIDAGRPIPGALSTLARYHFDPLLRRQLLFLRNEVEQGADMWQSMESIGLLSQPEAHVLETAERVDNRPWVLRQIANVKQQRTTRHLVQLSELALPVVVLLMGAFVLLQALGVFGPLVQILNSLD